MPALWILLALYFLPALIAAARHHHNAGSIFIIDLFLGWTFLGWIVALAMACSQVRPADPIGTSAAAYARPMRIQEPTDLDYSFVESCSEGWNSFIDWFNQSSLLVRGGIILAVLGFVLAAVISSLLQPGATSKKSPSAESSSVPAAVSPIPATSNYRLVESRGMMHIIFVSPACRNLEAMKALGDRLRADFADERIVGVVIFDDMRAARMYDRMIDSGGTLGARLDRFYGRHMIGNYSKNVNTSYHEYAIMLQGLDGPQVDINY